MKIRPSFGRVVDAYARGESIKVRCTDEDCDAEDEGVPQDLFYEASVDEMSVGVGDHTFWSNSTEVVGVE